MKIDLHSFGDVSAEWVAAWVYATVKQPSGTNQGLVAAISRLAKQGLTFPSSELVASHMAVNLLENASDTLNALRVGDAHCWLDGSVAPFCRVDQRSRRVQAVCIQSRSENKGASGANLELCALSRKPGRRGKTWRPQTGISCVVAWSRVAYNARNLANRCEGTFKSKSCRS